MKKLIAMLGAVVAAVTSAWAATVTESEGVYTVINSSGNAGNFQWNNVTSFSITIPAKGGLEAGDTVAISEITMVRAGDRKGDQDANLDTPVSMTLGGCTVNAVITGSVSSDDWDGISDRKTAVYTFTSKPMVVVGTAATVQTSGVASIRACPTSNGGDTDGVVGINNANYQPLMKIVCEKITTTTAKISADTEGVSEITWSNGTPSETNPGVLTIDEGVTLTVTDLTALNYVTLAGAGTLKVKDGTLNGRSGYTSPVTFGAEWTGVLHLAGTTLNWFDLDKFAGVGTIKMTGVVGNICGAAGATDGAFHGTLVLEDGEGDTVAFNLNDGFGTVGYVFDAISGSGTLKLTNGGTARQQLVFKDSTNFAGTVEIAEATNGNKKSVLFGNAKNITNEGNGCIIVANSATIPANKAWTTYNKIIINSTGTLTMNGSTESTLAGSGKLTGFTKFSTVPAAIKTLLQDAENWHGTLLFNAIAINDGAVTSNKTTLNDFGNANSKIEFAGNCNGYFGLSRMNAGDTEVAIVPEIVVSGNLTLNNGYTQKAGYEYYYTLINKLSGTGSVSCSNGNINQLLIIKDGASFAGSITATNLKVVIGEPAETMTLVANNTLTIAEGHAATIASGKSFKAANGITVDGTLTVAAGAAQKGLENNLTVGKTGTVTVNQSDWIKYDVGSAQTIKVAGTLDCGAKRQSFGANNKLVVVAGATITGVGDGEGAIDNFGGSKITIEADPTETDPATEVTWSATTRYRGEPELEVAEGVTLNMTGNVIVEATNAKTVTKTGAGVLKLMGSVAATVTHKLTAGTIVSNVEGLTVTVEEGATLYTQTDEGVTTYALTPFDPGEELPGEELIDSEEKEAYRAWATTIGVTEADADNAEKLVIGFSLGATEVSTVAEALEAAQDAVEELVKEIDLAALAGEGEEAALTALNTALAEKGLVASLEPVELEGASESTKLYKLVIELDGQN